MEKVEHLISKRSLMNRKYKHLAMNVLLWQQVSRKMSSKEAIAQTPFLNKFADPGTTVINLAANEWI